MSGGLIGILGQFLTNIFLKFYELIKNLGYHIADNINDLDLAIEDKILDIDPLWLTNWSYAVNKYYPKYVTNDKGFTGTILSDFPREYIDKINTICNNAKS